MFTLQYSVLMEFENEREHYKKVRVCPGRDLNPEPGKKHAQIKHVLFSKSQKNLKK